MIKAKREDFSRDIYYKLRARVFISVLQAILTSCYFLACRINNRRLISRIRGGVKMLLMRYFLLLFWSITFLFIDSIFCRLCDRVYVIIAKSAGVKIDFGIYTIIYIFDTATSVECQRTFAFLTANSSACDAYARELPPQQRNSWPISTYKRIRIVLFQIKNVFLLFLIVTN